METKELSVHDMPRAQRRAYKKKTGVWVKGQNKPFVHQRDNWGNKIK